MTISDVTALTKSLLKRLPKKSAGVLAPSLAPTFQTPYIDSPQPVSYTHLVSVSAVTEMVVMSMAKNKHLVNEERSQIEH